MKPAITLFYKEFRQHGAFALAMVILCLLFQVTTYESGRWSGNHIPADMYLFIALIVTALYAAAAAALAYSTEHADNTYTFLRKLPISETSIALGKIGWVFCGTALVLLGNSLLAAVWILPGNVNSNLAVAFGLTILEMLVWGLFWSTRCRSQVHAIIAGIACASLSAWFIANVFSPSNNDSVLFYYSVVPHRSVFIAIVAIFAVWGALRWFTYDSQSPWPKIGSRSPADYGLLRYPKWIQPPFFALVHQHVRHASILYHIGIAAFFIFGFGIIGVHFLTQLYDNNNAYIQIWGGFYAALFAIIILLFWGNIFGHDQKNDSYRFLSRLGIHEGKVWWSRMLPAFICYLIPSLCILLVFAYEMKHASPYDWRGIDTRWDDFMYIFSIGLSVWLAPLAMGAFFSISFRSQMVAIALTIGGTLTLLIWMGLFIMLFGSWALWTTAPLALALLLASRLRATYWLRETFTWRSRLMPLIPFFAVLFAISFVALPFVRVYSVPYVSWAQIDSFFDQADLQVRRDPEKRKALLQYIVERGTVPPEYEAMLEMVWHIDKPFPAGLTYEEFLLLEYANHRRYLDSAERLFAPDNEPDIAKTFRRWGRLMPWERERFERALRIRLVARLVAAAGGHPDPQAITLTIFCNRMAYQSNSVFDEGLGWFYDDAYVDSPFDGWRWNWLPMREVEWAMEKWYAEYGSLPESLDDLVGVYLDSIPTHPFTEEPVRYYVDSPPPLGVGRWGLHMSFTKFGGDPIIDQREHRAAFDENGGTYFMLGNRVNVLLVEPTEEMLE